MYVDDLRAVTTGDVISYTYFVETGYLNPITVTLVWMDPVGWLSAAKAVLHDLDLCIEVLESGVVYRGNNRTDEDNNGVSVVLQYTIIGIHFIAPEPERTYTE